MNERKIKIQTICRVPGGWHSTKEALPSAEHRHSAKFTLCRVPPLQHSAKDNGRQAPVPDGRRTAGARAGHVTCLCRVLAFRHSTKARYAECRSLPTACTRQSVGMSCATCLPSALGLALGKDRLCRVPVVWHSANPKTLCICAFSGSGRNMSI